MSNIEKQQSQAVAVSEKNITDQVLAKITAFEEAKQINLPKDYSAANALKAAWLVLQDVQTSDKKPVLEACTKQSIANALLKMVVWGLSPLKKQGDFIAYGSTLTFQPEYTGNIALAKRFGGLKWIKANAILEGEVFEFVTEPETGRRRIIKHQQSLESLGNANIVGAYAVYELEDGTRDVEIMNKSMIEKAWNQGTMKGNSPAHKNFPDQMAIKTVINRACKLLIRGSNDAVLFDDDTESTTQDNAKASAQSKVIQQANTQSIGFEEEAEQVQDAVVVEDKKPNKPSETLFENDGNPF